MNDSNLAYFELAELARLIASKALSSHQVTQALLDRIARLDGELASYALVLDQPARAAADAADREIAAGRYRGPLHGVPIAVKDLCWIKGFPTAAGTVIHRDFVPGEDATVVSRLKEAGAVLIGKTQMTEGAYSDHHPTITPPKNPWNRDYWTGISSSGSAVATAAGLCYGALASDTGGSIRWPAAATGVTGLKPSWGRVSRHGVFALAASLDHVGPMARSARDAGLILAVIAGGDSQDPTALLDPVPDYDALADRRWRIGIDARWNSEDVDAGIEAALAEAIEVFTKLGAEFVPVAMPDVRQAVEDWAPLCAVEAAVAHEATYPARQAEYGPVLSSVIAAGWALSGVDYQKILLRRMDFRGRVDALFTGIDLLLTPVQSFAPLSLARIRTLGEQPELIAQLQRFTCPFDMSGHPTLTFPGGFSPDGLPIGLQLIAGRLNEAVLIGAGVAFQRETRWHMRRPLA